ncbi:hypothetical protein GCM10010038_16290 [Glutamicibacter protophormiae]|nr:hypothetical protein GCM10010038_16290 [Glutamicibacter protophormiae]
MPELWNSELQAKHFGGIGTPVDDLNSKPPPKSFRWGLLDHHSHLLRYFHCIAGSYVGTERHLENADTLDGYGAGGS